MFLFVCLFVFKISYVAQATDSNPPASAFQDWSNWITNTFDASPQPPPPPHDVNMYLFTSYHQQIPPKSSLASQWDKLGSLEDGGRAYGQTTKELSLLARVSTLGGIEPQLPQQCEHS